MLISSRCFLLLLLECFDLFIYFFYICQAFKNYDEAGSPRRIACLKYLVVCTIVIIEEDVCENDAD